MHRIIIIIIVVILFSSSVGGNFRLQWEVISRCCALCVLYFQYKQTFTSIWPTAVLTRKGGHVHCYTFCTEWIVVEGKNPDALMMED
jgi:hypothetical protein